MKRTLNVSVGGVVKLRLHAYWAGSSRETALGDFGWEGRSPHLGRPPVDIYAQGGTRWKLGCVIVEGLVDDAMRCILGSSRRSGGTRHCVVGTACVVVIAPVLASRQPRR